MKRLFTSTLLVLFAWMAMAQMVEPVHFSSALNIKDDGTGEIVYTAKIDEGWHLYSTHLNDAGPTEAELVVTRADGIELVGGLQPRGNEIEQYDAMFGAVVKYFEQKAKFVQKVRLTKDTYALDCYLQYGACNNTMCLPPQEVPLKKEGTNPAAAAAAATDNVAAPEPEVAAADTAVTTPDTLAAVAPAAPVEPVEGDIYAPVVDELRGMGGSAATELQSRSLWSIFCLGLIGGLLALFMPCIWPIIPMTVSFFLKRAKDDRRRGIRDAATYGVSIVVIYLLLGLIITTLCGPSKLNELSTNAVFNIFLFLLLVVFALSFFGWFEIKLPSKWANAVDDKVSSTSGMLSIFLMAFTLALVSFSCTAPIIGLLLVDAVTSGNIISPAVGMFGFAIALALPFTLFAIFPSWLKQAPKSGSWMNTVKVVLGFIELAFALKFFSVADLAYGWHLMDREVFLSLWIVIFLLLGLYLIGVLRFQSDEVDGEQKPMSVACIMGGLASLAFAVYMLPGLWGAPCKAVSAFAPPMNTQDFNLNTHVVEARYTNYEDAMLAARREGKPLLVDFTGFGCVNCRKMEAAVWTDPRVADKLMNDYVLVSLYVDDKTPLAEPIEVEENGRTRMLRTIGDQWSYLQAHKFGSNTQPFYVALDTDGHPLAPAHSYKEDIAEYLDFLNAGLSRFKQ